MHKEIQRQLKTTVTVFIEFISRFVLPFLATPTNAQSANEGLNQCEDESQMLSEYSLAVHISFSGTTTAANDVD